MFVTHRVGSTEQAERAARLPRRGRPARRASSRSSSGGGPTAPPRCEWLSRRDRRRGARGRCRSRSRSRCFGAEELEAVAAAARDRLGRPGPVRARVRGAVRAPSSASRTRSRRVVHDGAAPRRRGAGAQAGRRGDRARFTWVATANVVEYMGAKPVFCDVDLRHVQHRRRRSRGAVIGPRTVGDHARAPVRPLRGHGRRSLEIAGRHGLWVVEDAACAFGAWYGGRHAGTLGDAGCFCFHPRKSITTGEGGMVTTERRRDWRRARTLAARPRRDSRQTSPATRGAARSCSPTTTTSASTTG